MPHETRESWHTRPIANLTAQFGTDVQQGLTCQEAAQRLQQGGPNELRNEQPVSALTLLAGQFGNLVIWVLIGAALSSVALPSPRRRRAHRTWSRQPVSPSGDAVVHVGP